MSSINKLSRLTKLTKASSWTLPRLALAMLVLVLVIAGGLQQAAATTPTLKLSPVSGSFSRYTIFTVQVRADSSDPINAVQANLSYSSNLSVIGIDYGSSAFPVQAESSYGSGQIRIARGAFTPLTGDVLVATVSFKALSRGPANITFNTPSSTLIRQTDSTNILGALVNGAYSVTK